jgi:hypothetical protein
VGLPVGQAVGLSSVPGAAVESPVLGVAVSTDAGFILASSDVFDCRLFAPFQDLIRRVCRLL